MNISIFWDVRPRGLVYNYEDIGLLPPFHYLSSPTRAILVFVDLHSWIILQISPTRCTILLNIFISPHSMFRASMCPSSVENHCICATLVFGTLYRWCLVCWLDAIQPADRTLLIQNTKHQCRTDTVIFSWWWAHGCQKHVEKRNKYIKQNCAPSWTYLQGQEE